MLTDDMAYGWEAVISYAQEVGEGRCRGFATLSTGKAVFEFGSRRNYKFQCVHGGVGCSVLSCRLSTPDFALFVVVGDSHIAKSESLDQLKLKFWTTSRARLKPRRP
jgi:hypothetical protein